MPERDDTTEQRRSATERLTLDAIAASDGVPDEFREDSIRLAVIQTVRVGIGRLPGLDASRIEALIAEARGVMDETISWWKEGREDESKVARHD